MIIKESLNKRISKKHLRFQPNSSIKIPVKKRSKVLKSKQKKFDRKRILNGNVPFCRREHLQTIRNCRRIFSYESHDESCGFLCLDTEVITITTDHYYCSANNGNSSNFGHVNKVFIPGFRRYITITQWNHILEQFKAGTSLANMNLQLDSAAELDILCFLEDCGGNTRIGSKFTYSTQNYDTKTQLDKKQFHPIADLFENVYNILINFKHLFV